jgi:filamentous hemagglutinin family protein
MHSRAPINRIYHLVWNPCPSGPAGFGQPSGGLALTACGRAWLAGALALSGGLLLAPAVLAGPQGATVSAGSGTVSQSGLNTTVQQSSQNLALNWQSFNLGANESLRFNQPNASSIVLNRITGQSPSQILGSISANGQVFVSNPNGVLFGSTAQVNVGGLVATTLGLSDADLMAKRYSFTATPGLPSASVSNQGTLSAADGGYLALLAPEVRNEGVLQARRGTALLAAGDKVTLHLNQGSLLSYAIDQGALNALADNRQLIQADGGRVFLSAKAANALTTAAVNNSGIIQARTAENVAGVIRLMGDMQTGTTTVSGTLDASAPNGGDGGSIETSAAHVRIASDARISTHANNGRVGSGLIDPLDFTIAASGGDISGATLSAALASTDVRIETGTGSVVCTGAACGVGSNGDGDIHVNDTVGWSSARTLTLSAWRNININQSISASHAAG